MQSVKASEVRNRYKPSSKPSAKNWQISMLWHSEGTRGEGIDGSFTVLNRVEPGGTYPEIRLTHGTMEYYMISGNFTCNGERYAPGDYVLFEEGETMRWSSETGGEMFIVLRGALEWSNA